MTDSPLFNDPQAVARLDSVACIIEWVRSMPAVDRKRFLGTLFDCREEVQQTVVTHLKVVKDPKTTTVDRQRAMMTIADALALNPFAEYGLSDTNPATSEADDASLANENLKTNIQVHSFAERLKELLATKQISQQELADRIGCSQPAISQMLNRKCRPQKKTILKLAEAFSVHPHELWPDIDVADMLDAVASFQEDGYTMTAAEANALADTAKKNRPKIPAKSLPTHH